MVSPQAIIQILATSMTSIDIPRVSADEAAVGTIMNTVYLWAGIIAVLIVVIGGLLYVTANGDANNLTRAKNTILYAIIGLIVVIFAFSITQLVIYFVS